MYVKARKAPSATANWLPGRRPELMFLLAVLISLAAAGCGQRGPLYLPEPTPIEIGEGAQSDENDDEAEHTP